MFEEMGKYRVGRLYPFNGPKTVRIPPNLAGGQEGHTAIIRVIPQEVKQEALEIEGCRGVRRTLRARDRIIEGLTEERAAKQERKWEYEDKLNTEMLSEQNASMLNEQREEAKTLSVSERRARAKKEAEEAKESITVEDYDLHTLVYVGVFATTLAGEIETDPGGKPKPNVTEEVVRDLPEPLLMFLAEQVYEHSMPEKNG